jgi:hypothetical protein
MFGPSGHPGPIAPLYPPNPPALAPSLKPTGGSPLSFGQERGLGG